MPPVAKRAIIARSLAGPGTRYNFARTVHARPAKVSGIVMSNAPEGFEEVALVSKVPPHKPEEPLKYDITNCRRVAWRVETQSSDLWKRRTLTPSRTTAEPAIAAICGHRMSKPTPFR